RSATCTSPGRANCRRTSSRPSPTPTRARRRGRGAAQRAFSWLLQRGDESGEAVGLLEEDALEGGERVFARGDRVGILVLALRRATGAPFFGPRGGRLARGSRRHAGGQLRGAGHVAVGDEVGAGAERG